MSKREQAPARPAPRPISARPQAGGAAECRPSTALKKTWAMINAIPASAHAHSGTILISAVNPVCVSFLTCINLSALSVPLPRLLAVVREVRAASQQQHAYYQRRRDEEKHEARL